ncbi:MAG: hypothetical protein ACHP84_03220 [Caulobacterales bacterium]
MSAVISMISDFSSMIFAAIAPIEMEIAQSREIIASVLIEAVATPQVRATILSSC